MLCVAGSVGKRAAAAGDDRVLPQWFLRGVLPGCCSQLSPDKDRRLALCGVALPCGAARRALLRRATLHAGRCSAIPIACCLLPPWQAELAASGGKKQDLIKITRSMGRQEPVAYHVTDKARRGGGGAGGGGEAMAVGGGAGSVGGGVRQWGASVG